MYFLKGGKPSGKEVTERKSKLQIDLAAGFVQDEGHDVSQRNVMSYLALKEDCAALSTRAIKCTFPLATTRSNREDGTYCFCLHLTWILKVMFMILSLSFIYTVLKSFVADTCTLAVYWVLFTNCSKD